MITALVEQTVTLFFWLYPQGNLTWDPSGRPSRKPDIVLVEKEKIILLVFKQTGSLSLTALQPGKTGVVVVKAGEWDRWSLPCTAANHDLSHTGLLQLFSRNGLLWLNRDTIAQFCNSSNLCHKNPQLGSPSSGLLLFHSSGGWRPATSSSPAESWVSQQKKSPNPTWF